MLRKFENLRRLLFYGYVKNRPRQISTVPKLRVYSIPENVHFMVAAGVRVHSRSTVVSAAAPIKVRFAKCPFCGGPRRRRAAIAIF